MAVIFQLPVPSFLVSCSYCRWNSYCLPVQIFCRADRGGTLKHVSLIYWSFSLLTYFCDVSFVLYFTCWLKKKKCVHVYAIWVEFLHQKYLYLLLISTQEEWPQWSLQLLWHKKNFCGNWGLFAAALDVPYCLDWTNSQN